MGECIDFLSGAEKVRSGGSGHSMKAKRLGQQ